MTVKLLHTNGLEFVDSALGQCYAKGCYTELEARDKRIKNIALKKQHGSVLEFANFIFEIQASTKVLLELSRHRLQSISCQSSRFTLNKVALQFENTGDKEIDLLLTEWKNKIKDQIARGKSNELTSLMLPQAFMYVWQSQFNARSLKNFLHLRTAKSAHFQIRDLAQAMYLCIPDEMKYLFKDDIK